MRQLKPEAKGKLTRIHSDHRREAKQFKLTSMSLFLVSLTLSYNCLSYLESLETLVKWHRLRAQGLRRQRVSLVDDISLRQRVKHLDIMVAV